MDVPAGGYHCDCANSIEHAARVLCKFPVGDARCLTTGRAIEVPISFVNDVCGSKHFFAPRNVGWRCAELLITGPGMFPVFVAQ